MCNIVVEATRLSRRGSPRQGRQNSRKGQFTCIKSKNLVKFAFHGNFDFWRPSVRKIGWSPSAPRNSQATPLAMHLPMVQMIMLKLFRSQTNLQIFRKSRLNTAQVIKMLRPIGKRIAPAAELLLELRLYELCCDTWESELPLQRNYS